MIADYKHYALRSYSYAVLFGCFFLSHTLFPQSKQQKRTIYYASNQNEIVKLQAKLEKEYLYNTSRMQQLEFSNGWKKKEVLVDGSVVALNDFGDDGTPLFYTTLMDPTSKVSRANTLHKGGDLGLELDGNGLQIGVWDAGPALETHQEFDTRVSTNDGSNETSSHATLVTGTLVSSGVKNKAKGVAYAAQALTNDWTRDKIEVVEAASNGMLLSNHSYGIKSDRVPDWYFGSYIKVSQDWDDIMYNAPYYLMVTAAGNAQNAYDNELPIFGKTQDGFDLLLGFATSKNGITVAGANTRIDEKGQLLSASVTTYSSLGPVDDGRVKPDIAGDGTSVFSTTSNSNSSYTSSSGTSMATPGVTGSLLLLQQYHEQLFGNYMKASTLKGLALHTADDVDAPGPDYKMGWGVLNSKSAAELLKSKDFSSIVSEQTLNHGTTYSITVKALGDGPLSASISWTDPKGEFVNRGNLNDVTAALTNDLDIRITQHQQTYLPWRLNAAKANDAASRGDNRVDPFERIDIENATGEYTITISHKGALTNGLQNFSLIVSGVELTPCSITVPKNLDMVASSEEGTTFNWDFTEETLYEIQVKEDEQPWVTTHSWTNELDLQDLKIGTRYQVRLRSVCTENMLSEYSEVFEFIFQGETTQELINAPLNYPATLDIALYPNPAADEIRVAADASKDAVYSIVTASGTIIKQGELEGAIPISDLSSGLYVLLVQDYAGIKSSKFYKN
ncbi:MAG: T9SS C-terminal target domain-containing protein [Allomuricauda sp.]|nr:MAG: T9SS C-terminal target domain-containing protein [Allomuricauda sp.]